MPDSFFGLSEDQWNRYRQTGIYGLSCPVSMTPGLTKGATDGLP